MVQGRSLAPPTALSRVEAFERHIVPAVMRPLAARLLAEVGLGPGERLLDLASGTGVVTRLAASGSGGVVVAGLDIDAFKLRRAIRLSVSTCGTAYVRGDAHSLPFAAGSFNAAVCQQGVQFFRHRERALGELRRVLAIGGRVALSVWVPVDRQPVLGAIRRALLRHGTQEAAAEFFACPYPARSMMPASRHRVTRRPLDALLRAAGFVRVDVVEVEHEVQIGSVRDFIEQYAAASSLGASLQSLGPERGASVIAEVEQELQGSSLVLRYDLATARCPTLGT